MSQKIASFYAEITADTRGFEQGTAKVKGGLQGLAGTIKGVIPSSVTGFLTLTGAITGVAAAMKSSIDTTIEYANNVRQLSMISGASTEDTSRFLQVLDDYKISAQDALVATRALTNEGHVPTIEALAKLSDEYLSLNSTQEKNEFVLKNLGRGGLQWVEVLQKGSKAIREQGDAVADNLILTQKMVDNARKAEISMDNWNDSVQGLKVSFANDLLPIGTEVLNFLQRFDRANELTAGKGFQGMKEWSAAWRQAGEEQDAATAAMLKNADAADTNADSLGNLTDASKAAGDAAKSLSSTLTGMLSAMFDITRANQDYQDTLADLAASDADLTAQKNQLTMKMWEEQRAGKLTNDEYLRYVQQLDEITKSQQENAKAREDAAKDQKNASNQRVFDLAQEKLAADGVISTGEFNYLQDLAVAKGLVTRAAADQAKAENQQADDLVRNFSMTQPKMDAALYTMQQIAGYDGHIVQFGVNFTTSGASMNAALAGMGGTSNPAGYNPPASTYHPISWNVLAGGGGLANPAPRDSGGSGMAGTPYMIGTGAQPEMFIPHTNGTFIPNADKKGWGSTYNVVINNPVPEKSENSIRRELKKLSYMGVAQ